MPLYTLNVIETICVEKTYIVDAPSATEAEEKAAIGDTVNETVISDRGVIHRECAYAKKIRH